MQHNKLLIIHTGGTIGMQASAKGYQTVAGFEQLLRTKLSAHNKITTDFDVLDLEPLLDSSNLQVQDWSRISQALCSNYSNYAGFVITHGTDTMSYSASALSFQLEYTEKPIIFTGSQIPLAEEGTDGLDNILGALEAAQQRNLYEICIYFNRHLLRGNRSRKVDANGLSAFASPNYLNLAELKINSSLLQPSGQPKLEVLTYQTDTVAFLTLYPSIPKVAYQAILEDCQIKAVILCSYGVGNLPNLDQEFMRCLRQANEQGKLIINLSSCLKAKVLPGVYASSAELLEMGILAGQNLTPEAAYTKLHSLFARNLNLAEIKEKMNISLCGEMD